MASGGIEERGAIFTRREVVDFILDLSGYTSDQPLHRMRLLEPSFGDGDFLLPVIDRLMTAWQASPERGRDPVAALSDRIRAVELHRVTFTATRLTVIARLTGHGMVPAAARDLADSWLIQGDFLLIDLPGRFHFVVGNPPYVRQEQIHDALLAAYRARYATVYDRADLYIPFIERSLTQLEEGGQLGFICADRWMKNRYGGPLRQLVAERFHLKTYVDMFGTPAFHTDVIAYPAITIIARPAAKGRPGGKERRKATRVAHRPEISAAGLAQLSADLTAPKLPKDSQSVREVEGVAAGSDPWILESSNQLALVRRLEMTFPPLEEAGCKVGIGVATGADQAFIGLFDALDVEPDRKLPLVMTRDIQGGTVQWRGFGVVNPFRDEGGLVNLDDYPRLKAYLEGHKAEIAGRHVAQKAPANWYRTIDRIYPAIAAKPKLLIPDIKGQAHIVHEDGQLYPHHNLYFITSDTWDLKALQAVLLSGIARLFVAAYSTKMHGGFLRFQAQYLRRIRVPAWRDVPEATRRALIDAAARDDRDACNKAVFQLYGLTATERAALGGNGE
ncbi:Eco57I restriction-modification methylase domain-containing protein [Falsiroseomonas tokyonensis]|nr:Eco57I restriction-modification methylase domain-containing protein [Falsiroseomonas tokyonensis]MBU8541761.1 Eco57I restriction-modification methylase domain-containing protein [Falsiroseomonas tokyonensis]